MATRPKGKKPYTTDWTVWGFQGEAWHRIATFHSDYFHAKAIAENCIDYMLVGDNKKYRVRYKLLPAGVEPKEAVK